MNGMTEYQKSWAEARDRLAAASVSLGYPGELADLLAKQLKSPKAIDRMTNYLYRARPKSFEMIADELLAITEETEAWRKKKESEAAQAAFSIWLNSDMRIQDEGEEA